jgi:signal transduction histidine kinase/CheY-like chemotaxis protein
MVNQVAEWQTPTEALDGNGSRAVLYPELANLKPNSTLTDLTQHEFRVSVSTPGQLVAEELERRKELPGVLVFDGPHLAGLISRPAFFAQMSRSFAREIYLQRPISIMLGSMGVRPLRLPASCGIAEAASAALNRPPEWAYEPIVVESNGNTFRILDIHVLLLAQSHLLVLARRIEGQMHQANKMEAIGQLAGGVAHDFNNLLTVILAGVSMLQTTLTEETGSRDILEGMERAASRASNLTSQLLGFSRSKAMRLEPTNLRMLIQETISLLRRTIDPSIEIAYDPDPELWTVEADPNQMSQVLMNLCLNARDAMPQGGRVRLETANIHISEAECDHGESRPGDFLRVSVIDSGCGIAPDVLPHIFEPFFTTKETGKGTGLGLAMIYSIVHEHRGWVECQSRAGHGSRFDVFLPRGVHRVVHVAKVEPPRAAGYPQAAILLVDDEEMIRHIGRSLLMKLGYSVLLAQDGQEAVEIYRDRPGEIDLVILDLRMPRLSGREALRQIRLVDPLARILFSSGFSVETITETEADGVLGFVSKPYRAQDLARAVERALAVPRG